MAQSLLECFYGQTFRPIKKTKSRRNKRPINAGQ